MNWFTTTDLLGREGPFTTDIGYTICYILVAVLCVAGICLLNKFKSQKAIKIVLIVLWAAAVLLDVVKLIVNICIGFVITVDLPVVICSLYMYVMPFAIWGKGKLKAMGCAYVCTIGLMGTILNFIFPSRIVNYSILSFFGFHTTIYHLILLITPIIMLCTGYYKFKFKDYGWAFLGFVVVTIPVIILSYIVDYDYMFFIRGSVPVQFVEDFATSLGYAAPLFMYLLYAIGMMVMQLIIMGITKLVEIIMSAIKKKKSKPATASNDAAAK